MTMPRRQLVDVAVTRRSGTAAGSWFGRRRAASVEITAAAISFAIRRYCSVRMGETVRRSPMLSKP